MQNLVDQLFGAFLEITESSEFQDHLSSLRGSSIFRSQLSIEQAIKQLNSEYWNNNNLVLVLGAGVSFKFGIPSWPSLLRQLMVGTLDFGVEASSSIAGLFDLMFAPNPLISGRYLQLSYEQADNLDFEVKVREVLYARSLGVNTIWVDSHDALPGILNRIRTLKGD